MANTQSAKKMMRVAERRRVMNKPVRTTMRTELAKARAAVSAGAEDVEPQVRHAISILDKAAKRGVIHPNTAARRKSRLMKLQNTTAAIPHVESKGAAKRRVSKKAVAPAATE